MQTGGTVAIVRAGIHYEILNAPLWDFEKMELKLCCFIKEVNKFWRYNIIAKLFKEFDEYADFVNTYTGELCLLWMIKDGIE